MLELHDEPLPLHFDPPPPLPPDDGGGGAAHWRPSHEVWDVPEAGTLLLSGLVACSRGRCVRQSLPGCYAPS
jgi:hypothetical protein